MQKLPAVETAKELMTEALGWSVMKWLQQKKRVRSTADQANLALDQLSASLKQGWPESLKAAYAALGQNGTARARLARSPFPSFDPATVHLATKLKQADEQACHARMDAEKTFDEADRKLSTALAREGCRKAILAWELHQKAIEQAALVDGTSK
jgi:hypothetical protein